jgi:hypothetical protein
VRRPNLRFDVARNAWVTTAGGKLKVLSRGPKNKDTEAAAWDAFYVHMTKLGNPVEGSSLPAITLGQRADKFGEWLERKVQAGRLRPRTLEYYQDHISQHAAVAAKVR